MWPFDNKIVNAKLDTITKILMDMQRKETLEMAQIDDLKQNVADLITSVVAEGTVVGSAVAAIKGLTDQIALLSQQLADAIASGDPVAIQAAADAIKAQNDAIVAQTIQLAQAIPQNTPSE